MRTLALTLLGLGLLAPDAPATTPSLVPGRIVVRYRPDSGVARRLDDKARALGALALSAGSDPVTGASLNWLVPPGNRGRPGDAETAWRARTVQVHISPKTDVESAARAYAARPDVEWARPVRLVPLAAAESVIPDDPAYGAQWHHQSIRSPEAWEQTTGDPDVVIGVIDTGVDTSQPDLAPTLWTNVAEAAGLPGVDDDANGYIDDLHGFDFTDVPEIDGAGDFVDRDGDPQDDVGHGTWVAGAACGAGNNHIGGAGVAFGARFMALRAGFRPRNSLSLGYLAEDDAAAAIVYAVDNGARILNLSFGDLVRAPILEDAVRFALARDVLVVAAAGNAGTGAPFYPAAVSGVLAVGASDRNGLRASFSSFGNDVLLLAPGVSILTTEIGGGETAKSGTSLAAPIAAGAAALILSRHPDWPPDKVISAMLAAAREPAAGVDLLGAKLLDAGRAINTGGEVTISLPGLDDGVGVDQRLVVRGDVFGPGVRGWRLQLRRGPDAPWRTLGESFSSVAFDDTLAVWNAAGEPEGAGDLRVEAVGSNGIAGAHHVSLVVDHSPPVIKNQVVLPIVAGDGYGFRLTVETDDTALGCVSLGAGDSTAAMAEIVGTTHHVLGLNGPYPAGSRVQADVTMVNRARLSSRFSTTVQIPERAPEAPLAAHAGGPPLITLLPRLVDLDGNGRPELVGETAPTGAQNYGRVAAYDPGDLSGGDSFTSVWESDQTFLPQDAGDFDGDGRIDLLGLAVQEIRVYSPGPAVGFPSRLSWLSTDAWASHFIPAPDQVGLDIVASRDTEIQIYRREGSELVLRQTLENPTTGSNGISPLIISAHFERGGPLSLATIDGDGDLLIYRRRPGGEFEFQFSRKIGASASEILVAADVDGDGADELGLVHAIGEFPSPSDGLRDGYFQLQLFKVASGGLEIRGAIGSSGFFPGNPVGLTAADLDGDGAKELWWAAGGRLYRLVFEEGEFRLDRSWTGISAERSALWARPAAQGGDVLFFPGEFLGSGVPAGPASWIARSTASGADPRRFGLTVERATDRGAQVDLSLRWHGDGEVQLERERLGLIPDGTSGPGLTRLVRLSAQTFVDTGLVAGARYKYHLSAVGSERVADTLTVIARPTNAQRSVTRDGNVVIAEWTEALRPLEGATLLVVSATTGEPLAKEPLYPTFDRSNRRLIVGLPPGFDDEPAKALLAVRYLSGSNLPLRLEDARIAVPPPRDPPRLTVRRVTVLDAQHLQVHFEPAAPLVAKPEDFSLQPPRVLRSATTSPPQDVLLELADPVAPGAWSLTVAPGVEGPNGTRIEVGRGDALAFRVGPTVFPNPARNGHPVLFQGLVPGSIVTLFDLNGRVVWTSRSDETGGAVWEGQRGARLTPGIYLYHISGLGGGPGKLAIVD